jgi:hypothetical protein
MNRAAPACALLAATACGCASLAHLLLYAAELHPRVREALLAEPRLPRRLEYITVLGNERTTVVWELRERSTAAAGELQGAGAAYALRPVLPEGAAALAVRVPDAAASPAPAAWACWDAARAVAPPGTSLLGELDRLEGGLRSRHPE